MISTPLSNKKESIIEYFNNLIPNAKPELDFVNEYQLLVAVILSAQTTDKSVNKVTKVLFEKYKNFNELNEANISDVKIIIEELGLSNNKSKYLKSVAALLHNKEFPKSRAELERLPGVGRKTANIILSVLEIENAFAVDTHVARVAKRLGIAEINDTPLIIENKLTKMFENSDFLRLHHQFILFGRYYCTAKNPKCQECGLKLFCFYKSN